MYIVVVPQTVCAGHGDYREEYMIDSEWSRVFFDPEEAKNHAKHAPSYLRMKVIEIPGDIE